jgi:hypothetical protein
VQHQDNGFAVGPPLDLRAKKLAQVSGGNVVNLVFLVDYDRHVVGETRGEKGQKKNSNGCSPANSHRQVRFQIVVT